MRVVVGRCAVQSVPQRVTCVLSTFHVGVLTVTTQYQRATHQDDRTHVCDGVLQVGLARPWPPRDVRTSDVSRPSFDK
jgi:hypothetical protein